MRQFPPKLDNLVLEIRYDNGNLYFDRCGQCLSDVERECEGWLTRNTDAATGTMERLDRRFRVGFNNRKFDFSAQQASETDLEEIAEEASGIWRIIQANLGLDTFMRIGYRPVYLLATRDVDEAEDMLRSSELNVKVPDNLSQPSYDIKSRQTVIQFTKDSIEYRVKFGSITRHEAVNPSNILSGDPRALSERQREFRIEQLRQMAEYSGNPMYAVCLDVDCVTYEPEGASIVDYVLGQNETIKRDFLPILEKL